jgi:hypothetical protein
MIFQDEDVIHTDAAGGFHGAVITPVVNNQRLDPIDPGDRFGQIQKRRRQVFLFIVAGNLDDEFHGPSKNCGREIISFSPSLLQETSNLIRNPAIVIHPHAKIRMEERGGHPHDLAPIVPKASGGDVRPGM